MDRSQPASSNLMETHNRLVAAILTHYRTLMMLATVQAEATTTPPQLSSSSSPGPDGAAPTTTTTTTPEAIAVAGIAMKMEFDGLYSSVKELLTLSRRIKELWVFGALGRQDPRGAERAARVEADVRAVARSLAAWEERGMGELAARHGGAWEPLRREDVLALQALAGKQPQ